MKKSLLMLAMMLLGYTAFAQNTDIILDNYLKIKDALVSSDNTAAANAVVAFQEALKAEKAFSQKDGLLKGAEKMAKSSDIEKQRAAFTNVSTDMWSLLKKSSSLGQDVYYQYCPMKKSYWISQEATIQNPYFGSKMLSCGSVSDKKLIK